MSAGRLVLVATPIGNLGDLSPRAVEALRDADVIAAEDTRRARKLLSAAGVSGGAKLLAYHRDNERRQAGFLVEQCEKGRSVVVVSDAGMPALADPGEVLVRRCLDAGIDVEVVPGPSAITTAVAVSGLPTGRFTFESFLPRAKGELRRRLESLGGEVRTMVFFEAPNRVGPTLAAMAEVFGGSRRAAVCRELTKLHEEVARGSLTSLAAQFAEGTLGEVVIVVEGGEPPPPADDAEVLALVTALLAEGLTVRDASARAAAELGVSKKVAYRLALQAAG